MKNELLVAYNLGETRRDVDRRMKAKILAVGKLKTGATSYSIV